MSKHEGNKNYHCDANGRFFSVSNTASSRVYEPSMPNAFWNPDPPTVVSREAKIIDRTHPDQSVMRLGLNRGFQPEHWSTTTGGDLNHPKDQVMAIPRAIEDRHIPTTAFA